MKKLTAIVLAYSLSIQSVYASQGEIGDKATVLLKRTVVEHYTKASMTSMIDAMNAANKHRNDKDFVEKSISLHEKENADYLKEVLSQVKGIKFPEIKFVAGEFVAKHKEVTLSFTPMNVMQNEFKLNGKVFTLAKDQSLKALEATLVEHFSTKKKTGFFQTIIDAGIPEAQAVGLLFVAAVVITLLGILGVNFWFKSKTEKAKMVADALTQANQDLQRQARMCREGRQNDDSYNATFDLLSQMIKSEYPGKDKAQTAMTTAMMKEIDEKEPTQCKAIVDEFVTEALGGTGLWATGPIADAKSNLCGGGRFYSESNGSYEDLKNCIQSFYVQHQNVTDKNRYYKSAERITDDIELIRDREYFSGVKGR